MTNIVFKIIANKFRKEWAANDAERNRDFKYPENVTVTKNIYYGSHEKWNLLDVYKPVDSADKLPCIVVIHGGGFFYGDKEIYSYYAADLAARGFVTVCFNYRLSPESVYPSQLEDINSVMKWISDHGESYGIDINKLFFAGDSAGGNLAYNYSAILTNRDYAEMFDFKVPENIMPKGVGLNCGVYDFDLLDGGKQNLMHIAYVGSRKKIKKNIERLTIRNFVTEKFPPTFIMSAPNDFVLCHMDPLVQLLKSKGVKVVPKMYGDKDDKNACHVFHLNLKLDIATACNNEECDFFKSLI